MRVLSLFSGAGMGDLGLMLAGMEIVGQCEIDKYCQKILALRFPETIKWKDVRDVTGKEVKEKLGTIDVVAGGFPCQPFSTAGNQRGSSDDRHLWPEMFRIISEVRPTWVIGENVPGIIGIALDDVLHDLEVAGYECGTFVFPAHACGAPHRRDRVWIVAYSGSHGHRVINRPYEDSEAQRCSKSHGQKRERIRDISRRSGKTLAYTIKPGLEGHSGHGTNGNKPGWDGAGQDRSVGEGGLFDWRKYWNTEPQLGRVAHGVPNRVDRLKALGNGQVVYCTKFIGEQIMRFKNADAANPNR